MKPEDQVILRTEMARSVAPLYRWRTDCKFTVAKLSANKHGSWAVLRGPWGAQIQVLRHHVVKESQ